MTTLLLGQQAPDFSVINQDGEVRTLADYAKQWLLLYFYPKDNTPGCTVEAQVLRDAYKTLQEYDVEVVGVSKDSADSHKKFIAKQNLPFELLADTEHEMLKAYGVWKEKSMFGKKYMGIVRTSFLISPDGVIEKIYDKVKPATHAEEVLEDIRYLQSEHVSA